jgi:hypothetical protein
MREGVLWTNLSLRALSRRLVVLGTPASRRTIRRLLRKLKLGRRTARKKKTHSTELCGEACPHSSEASGGEALDIEEPVSGWDCSTLHFHATLAGMLSATLVRNKVIEVRESREKRLLTAPGW